MSVCLKDMRDLKWGLPVMSAVPLGTTIFLLIYVNELRDVVSSTAKCPWMIQMCVMWQKLLKTVESKTPVH